MNNVVKKEHKTGIDYFKFFMAICVVAIHTDPIPSKANSLYELIISIAVPYFFIASGYLLSNKISKNKDSENAIIKNYIYKMLKLYIYWSIIYLPISIYYSINSKEIFYIAIIKYIKDLLFVGQHWYSWQLWYLLSIIYSVTLIYILKKLKIKNKNIFFISILIFLFGETITYLCTNIELYNGLLHKIVNFLSHLLGNSGRIFSGIFYIMIGFIFNKKYQDNKNNIIIYSILFTLLFYLSLTFNFTILKVLLYISCFALSLSIKSTKNTSKYFRESSTIIYFTHMIFFFIFGLIVGFNNNEGLYGFIITIVSTLILSIIIIIFKRRNKSKIIKELFN